MTWMLLALCVATWGGRRLAVRWCERKGHAWTDTIFGHRCRRCGHRVQIGD